MSLSDEQWIFLRDVATLIEYADNIGVKLTGGELWRTKAQQRIYFKAGKSNTLNSAHLNRLAIDFNFFIEGRLIYEHPKITKLGDFWESLSPKNIWGGYFQLKNGKDTPHFERSLKNRD